jgi:hypothetical protein
MKNQRQKMLVRYAAITALGESASPEEKKELNTIEDHLHLSGDSILEQATRLALASTPSRELTPLQVERFRRGNTAFRKAMHEIQAARKLH